MTADYFAWPDAAVDIMRTMRAKGDSCRVIADRLSLQFKSKISRNAVIGKLSRMGISMSNEQKSITMAASNFRRARAKQPKPEPDPRKIAEREAERLAKLKRLTETPRSADVIPMPRVHPDSIALDAKTLMHPDFAGCRWPLQRTDPQGETLFCCNSRGELRPYCAGHAARAFQKQRSSEQKAADQLLFKERRAAAAAEGRRSAFGFGAGKRVAS